MNIIFKIIQHLPETDQIVVKFCRQNAPKPIDEYDAVAVNLEYINFNDPVSFSASLVAYGMGMIETQLRSEPILDENKSNIDLNSTNSTNIDDYVEDPSPHAQTVAWRDDIAQRIWDAYLVELAARGLAPPPP